MIIFLYYRMTQEAESHNATLGIYRRTIREPQEHRCTDQTPPTQRALCLMKFKSSGIRKIICDIYWGTARRSPSSVTIPK
jgi:hypothetical protein